MQLWKKPSHKHTLVIHGKKLALWPPSTDRLEVPFSYMLPTYAHKADAKERTLVMLQTTHPVNREMGDGHQHHVLPVRCRRRLH